MFKVAMAACMTSAIVLISTGFVFNDTRNIFMNDTDRLKATDLEEQVKELLDQRQRISRILIRSLDSEESEVKFTAAALLGFYRYPEAVRPLASRITLEDAFRWRSKEALWDRYPAAEALVRIGKPSIPVMIEQLATSDDAQERKLSARVIFYVEGPVLSEKVMEMAIEAEKDQQRKQRLEEALLLVIEGKFH